MRYKFSEITVNYDSKRVPLSAKQRESRKGQYPYYGAQGIIDYIDDYIFDGKYLLIAEDGENLRSKKQKVAQLAVGRYWVNNHAHIVQTNEKCLLEYLYYLFNVTDISGYITGSAQPKLSQANLNAIEFELPTVQEQAKVVSILSALDDKIELNQKINENLERQAFALFENLLADAPDKECVISDIAILNPRRSIAKNQLAKCIDMAHLPTSGAFPTGWETKPFNGGMKFSNGDTLLARITPCLENGKTAFIDFLEDGEVAFGSTEYIVLSPKEGTPPEFLYCLARYPLFVDYAVKNMNGSSGRQRVSADTVGQYCLPKLSCEDFEGFGNTVAPLFLKMRYNSLENMRLSALRDTLIPKLMSGELDVSSLPL